MLHHVVMHDAHLRHGQIIDSFILDNLLETTESSRTSKFFSRTTKQEKPWIETNFVGQHVLESWFQRSKDLFFSGRFRMFLLEETQLPSVLFPLAPTGRHAPRQHGTPVVTLNCQHSFHEAIGRAPASSS